MAYIGWLDNESEDLAHLGGKGASLAVLHRAGFDVPPGFCVRAAAYRRFIEANDLRDAIQEVLAVPDLRLPKVAREACASLTTHIEQARLPDDVVTDISAAYARLRDICGSQVVVAARSSALSEDAAAASSAGLYETYLNLRDEQAVLDGVLHCYRSTWTPRAVQYRAFKQIDGAREAMAVVVMRMIDSDVSGVAFTVNPLSGDRGQIMVNASWGLGETIVSGRVTPDQFVLEKASLTVLQREIAPKEVETRPDPGGASGTVELTVPPGRASTPALSDDQIADLGAVCLRVEQHYGRPMDIEWAFKDGRLFILQARPVTGIG